MTGDIVPQAAALRAQGKRAEAAALLEQAAETDPNDAAAQRELADTLEELGRSEEAVRRYRRCIELAPGMVEAHVNLGVTLGKLGRDEAAAQSYRRALALQPELAVAHNNLGIALRALRRPDEALACFRRAVGIDPGYARAHDNLGAVLGDLGRHAEAVPCHCEALRLNPLMVSAYYNLGCALASLGQPREALAAFGAAVERQPEHVGAHFAQAQLLRALGQREAAVQSYRRVLEMQPDLALAHSNLGSALLELDRPEEAIVCLRRAVEIEPRRALAHDNLGAALGGLGRHDEAIECFRAALQLRPELADTHYNLGHALSFLERRDEAIAAFRAALALRPDHVKAQFALVLLLWDLDQLDDTVAGLQRVLALEPDHPAACAALAFARRVVCDWSTLADDARTLTRLVREDRSGVPPYQFLMMLADQPADLLRCAQRYVRDQCRSAPATLARHARPSDGRIRLGYLSADFRMHAVSLLIAELLEIHDRQRFDVIGFSFGRDDGTQIRRRVERAFDEFHEIRSLGHRPAAELIAARGIDVLVDLGGLTASARPQILAQRPAPIQVTWLGFAGTTGADFVDYILVDPFVVPPEHQPHFSEKLVHLPDSFLVADRKQAIADPPPGRAECGLPEQGFVFCAFNANYKITPQVFGVWMRLLQAVPGSVLWLTRYHPPIAPSLANLRREAAARGVNPERLVFAPYLLDHAQHLARYRLADLFLDTLPYNAHSTASDALWAGLPVLTCAGRSFAGRVAGSLLRAVGLPELITTSLEEYEALALALARDPARLAALRTRLAHQRTTMPLFDTERQRHSIERAYGEMWRRHEAGLPPAPFAVADERLGVTSDGG